MAWPKRIRSEVNEGVVIVNNPRPVAVSYPHPPPPPPPTTHIVSAPPPTRPSSADKQTAAFSPSFIPPQEHHGNRRRGNLLSEDWGLLDKVKLHFVIVFVIIIVCCMVKFGFKFFLHLKNVSFVSVSSMLKWIVSVYGMEEGLILGRRSNIGNATNSHCFDAL